MNKLLFLLLFISLDLFAQAFIEFTNYSINDSSKDVKYIKILMIGAIHNYNSNIIEYYKYTNIYNQLGGINVLFYSNWYNLLTFNIMEKSNMDVIDESMYNKIIDINPDYIILYYFDINKYKKTQDLLESKHKNNYYTIGYDSTKYDINLKIDFNKLDSFLDEINYNERVIYFLTNPRIKIFNNLIDNKDINVVNITKLSELRVFLRNVKKSNDNAIIINNLNYLFSNVDGKLLYKNDILNELYEYSLSYPFIDISFDNQYRIPTYFEFEWDFLKIFELLDTFIVSNYYDIGDDFKSSTSIDSKLNVTLEQIYKMGLIDNYDLLSISNYINFFNDVH